MLRSAKRVLDNPDNTITFDFECYYDTREGYTLNKMDAPRYIADPRFKILGLVIKEAKHPAEFFPEHGIFLEEKMPSNSQIHELIDLYRDCIWSTHNGHFDFLILKEKFDFVPKFMVDTRQLAHHVFGAASETAVINSVDKVAERLQLEHSKMSIDFMDGVRDPDPLQQKLLNVYACNDGDMMDGILRKLLPMLSRPQFELWLADHTMRLYLENPIPVDQEAVQDALKMVRERDAIAIDKVVGNKAMVPVTVKGKKGRKTMPDEEDRVEIQEIELDRGVLASNKKFAGFLKEVCNRHAVHFPTKKNKKKQVVPALAKKDHEFRVLRYIPEPEIRDLVEARMAVTSVNTIVARLNKLIGLPNDELRAYLAYYGAHTGRFAGGAGFNMQNITNPDRAPTEEERQCAIALRRCLYAGTGKVFVDVDAAQIEARVLAWLAGEDSLIQGFAEGADIYSRFISKVVDKPVKKGDKERQIGKNAILGLGFQMGKGRFVDQLMENPGVAPLIASGELPTDLLHRAVDGYREQHPAIVAYWGRLEKAFHHTRRTGRTTVVGEFPARIRFVKVGRDIHAQLPSSRTIRYPNLREEPRKKGAGTMWVFGNGRQVYGGSLTENVVQGTARDILAEGIYAAEAENIPVILHIHDSLISRVEEVDGEKTKGRLIEILSEPPPWAEGCPLAAEGKVSRRLM